jgi:hypothetical protein
MPERDPVLDRPRRERVTAVVDPPVVEPCGTERRRPLAMSERLDVDVAATHGRNQGERVDIFVRNDLEFSQVYALEQ